MYGSAQNGDAFAVGSMHPHHDRDEVISFQTKHADNFDTGQVALAACVSHHMVWEWK